MQNNPLGLRRDYIKEEHGELEGLHDAIADSGRDFLDYDPVGLPDDADYDNIRTIIRNYEKARPGEIKAFVKQAKNDRDIYDATFRTKAVDEPRRPVLTLPVGLMRDIEEAYPIMFRNRKHLEWFKAHFPAFRTRSK